jgi:hypothetical protein
MSVKIAQVTSVVPHPDSDKLDIVTIAGKINVANRPAPETPRYKVGDYAIVLEENLILPEKLIKHLHMWDDVKNKGGMAGSKGNRTKGRNVGGIKSEVALCECKVSYNDNNITIFIDNYDEFVLQNNSIENIDMMNFLEITEYVPQ